MRVRIIQKDQSVSTVGIRWPILPSLLRVMESGAILVKILEYFDALQLFNRYPGNPVPMLIVDGQQSILDDLFLTSTRSIISG